MTPDRDKNAAKELGYLRTSTSHWCNRISEWADHAQGEGATQHNLLYSDIADHLDAAVEELKKAADLMNPDVTEIETYESPADPHQYAERNLGQECAE